MGLNSLENLEKTLLDMKNIINVSEETIQKAQISLNRMTSLSYEFRCSKKERKSCAQRR